MTQTLSLSIITPARDISRHGQGSRGSKRFQKNCATAWGWGLKLLHPRLTPPFQRLGIGSQLWRHLRAGNSCHEQLGSGHAICQASCPFSAVPSLSPKAEDSDVLLPLLLLFGAFSQEAGVTPQAADPAQALPLPQPSDTPWAQRRDCNTAATTQEAAPATLNYLPDHRDHRSSPG